VVSDATRGAAGATASVAMVPYSLNSGARKPSRLSAPSFEQYRSSDYVTNETMAMPMAACNQIIGYLDELLNPTAYDDYGPNGLQVPGSEQIQTVVTGVSANLDLFTRAREEGADLVLVHHGLFWAGPPRALDRASKRRLQLLFDADLALAAVVGVVGDLLGALGAPERVDAGVLGDLVDPRLEGDRGLGRAHAPQGGHEHVLRDVLGPSVVVDHPVDVGPDPPLVAVVEHLEGMVVACAHGCHQRLVGGFGRSAGRCWCDG